MARVGFSHYPVVDVPDLITLICGYRERKLSLLKHMLHSGVSAAGFIVLIRNLSTKPE
jgi:hypothetical protein